MAAAPVRLLCVTRASNTTKGGMERLSFEFIANLKKQPELDVQVITHTGSRLTAPLFSLVAIPRILQAAKEVDVVHIGDPLLSLAGWLIVRFLHKPVAVTVHGLDIVYPNALYRWYLKNFFTKLTAYWPISRYVADLLQAEWHIPTSKITRLLPGTTDTLYDPAITREALEKLLNRSLTSTKVILTTGRLIKRKGVAWFIEQVLPHLPANTLYVIAGAGPEAIAIAAASEQAHVADRVVLLGRVPAEQLKILYNTVDAFIQPNIVTPHDVEGFGLVVVEAALCERPVFAADLEGLADALVSGHNGTLLPSGDSLAWIKALQQFLDNPADHKPTGQTARQYTLEHYLWANIISTYVTNLLPLMKGSSLSERSEWKSEG